MSCKQITYGSLIWDWHNDQGKKNFAYQFYLSRHYLPSEKKQSIRAAQTGR